MTKRTLKAGDRVYGYYPESRERYTGSFIAKRIEGTGYRAHTVYSVQLDNDYGRYDTQIPPYRDEQTVTQPQTYQLTSLGKLLLGG